MVEAAVEVLPEAPGVVAAWLGGSLASGVADVHSDVDLNVALEDDRLDDWRASWPALVERCSGPLVLAQPIGGDVLGGLALTTSWEHVDLVGHPVSRLVPPDPCRILHDPRGLLEERLEAPRPVAPYYPANDATLFFYLLGNLTVTLGRDELVVAHGGVGALRDLLVRLMLAENGVRKSDGQKRLNPYLSAEQRAVLAGLPVPPVEAGEIVRACREIHDEYVDRARLLASGTGGAFPERLLVATEDHLRQALGPSWRP